MPHYRVPFFAVLFVGLALPARGEPSAPVLQEDLSPKPPLLEIGAINAAGLSANNPKLGQESSKLSAGAGFDGGVLPAEASAVPLGAKNAPAVTLSHGVEKGFAAKEVPSAGVYAAEAPSHANWDRTGTLKAAAVGLGAAAIGFALGGPIGAAVGFLAGFFIGAGLWHFGILGR